MAFLVLSPVKSDTCTLQVMDEGSMVPKQTITWYLERPEKLVRVNNRIKKYWVGGTMYASGAIIGMSSEELSLIITGVLGPSNEEIQAKKQTKPPTWVLILFIISSLTVVGIGFGLRTITLLALVPVLIFFFRRRM